MEDDIRIESPTGVLYAPSSKPKSITNVPDSRHRVTCTGCFRKYLTDLAIELCIRRGHTDPPPTSRSKKNGKPLPASHPQEQTLPAMYSADAPISGEIKGEASGPQEGE